LSASFLKALACGGGAKIVLCGRYFDLFPVAPAPSEGQTANNRADDGGQTSAHSMPTRIAGPWADGQRISAGECIWRTNLLVRGDSCLPITMLIWNIPSPLSGNLDVRR
jgi:hypothetical protein